MAPEPVTGGCVLIQWTEVSCEQKGEWSFRQEGEGHEPSPYLPSSFGEYLGDKMITP